MTGMEKLSVRNGEGHLQQRVANANEESGHRQHVLQHWSVPRLDWEQLHSRKKLKSWC